MVLAVALSLAGATSSAVANAAPRPQPPAITVTALQAVPVPKPDAAPTPTTPQPRTPTPSRTITQVPTTPAAKANAPKAEQGPHHRAHTSPKPHRPASTPPSKHETARAPSPAALPTPALAHADQGLGSIPIGLFTLGAVLLVAFLALAVKKTRSSPRRSDTTKPEPVAGPADARVGRVRPDQPPTLHTPTLVKGALVLCDSKPDTKRVTATLLRRFGAGVETADDLETALGALRGGANAAVLAGTPGGAQLASAAWWPPTIVLGRVFAEAELRPVFSAAGRDVVAAHLSPDQARLDSELERAFRYLAGVRGENYESEPANPVPAGMQTTHAANRRAGREFTDRIAAATGLTDREAALVVEAFLDTINDALRDREPVKLTGFGTFSTRRIANRAAVTPDEAGAKAVTPPTAVPTFSAGSGLREAMRATPADALPEGNAGEG